MNATTGIEWTDATSNPVKYRDRETGQVVWACVKHSSGCLNCYAETLAKRYGRGGPFTKAQMAKVEPFLCPDELCQVLRSPKLAGKRCFVGDMTDVFGEWVSDEMLDTLLAALALRLDATFQVLTKRADRLAAYMRTPDRKQRIAARTMDLSNMLAARFRTHTARLKLDDMSAAFKGAGPLRNVWFGVSVEDLARTVRIDELRDVPAAVRFLSVEPLIGDVGRLDLTGIHWVIVGGESGAGSRPCQVDWIRSVVRQCRAAGVPCFVKQLGSRPLIVFDSDDSGARGIDGDGFVDAGNGLASTRLLDRKGGDPAEWPDDLNVREFPAPVEV